MAERWQDQAREIQRDEPWCVSVRLFQERCEHKDGPAWKNQCGRCVETALRAEYERGAREALERAAGDLGTHVFSHPGSWGVAKTEEWLRARALTPTEDAT